MFKIIFATGNEGKMREIRSILGDMEVEVSSMKEAGLALEIEEDGVTFEENARIKADAVATALAAQGKAQDCVVMADDSGLEIDYLNGEPGVYSARYLGEETPFSEKSRDLLRPLRMCRRRRGAQGLSAPLRRYFPMRKPLLPEVPLRAGLAVNCAATMALAMIPSFICRNTAVPLRS